MAAEFVDFADCDFDANCDSSEIQFDFSDDDVIQKPKELNLLQDDKPNTPRYFSYFFSKRTQIQLFVRQERHSEICKKKIENVQRKM